MSANSRGRIYDYRIRDQIVQTGNPDLFPHLEIPRGTAYRYMSIRALALRAQRVGAVFAHPSTWGKLIREHGWRRPRLRMYPAKPKEGVQATRPNEKWHVDASVLRLLDGSKVYLHAVIDNFSRRILAWQVADSLNPMSTCEVLQEAARNLHRDESVQVVCDSGIENFNGAVDAVIEKFDWERIRALVEVTYSSSKIEAWWRSLKHQWLYLNQLSAIADVRRLTKFYVDEHNRVLPMQHSKGRRPTRCTSALGRRS